MLIMCSSPLNSAYYLKMKDPDRQMDHSRNSGLMSGSHHCRNILSTYMVFLMAILQVVSSQVINPDGTGEFYKDDQIDISLETYFKDSNMTLDYFNLTVVGGSASIPLLLSKPRTVPFGFTSCTHVIRKSALSILVACNTGTGASLQSGIFWMSYQPLADTNQLTTTSVVLLPVGAALQTFTFEPSCGKLFVLGSYSANSTQV